MPRERRRGRDERALRLTAVSYNVHSCVGRDGRFAPERTLAVLKSAAADVVGLQEVDTRIGKPRRVDQFRYFAERSGMQCIVGPNIAEHRGEYGNLLLTRLPIDDYRLLRFGVRGREPRGAIIAILRSGHERLQVVNTHLGLRRAERREQLRKLAAATQRFGGPTLFMGDFNIWQQRSAMLHALGAPRNAGAAPRTFPSRRPLLALDRIWTDPADLTLSVRALRTELAALASDHLPVVAEVRLPRDEADAVVGVRG